MLGLRNESDLLTYNGDGTVENAQTLSGKTADKLLQSNTCGANQVWLGIENGKPKCGDRTPMLASIGNVASIA